jgi:hypothetical protein
MYNSNEFITFINKLIQDMQSTKEADMIANKLVAWADNPSF